MSDIPLWKDRPERCPKCKVKWWGAAEVLGVTLNYIPPNSMVFEWLPMDRIDSLLQTCRRCGYTVRVRCADYEEDDPTVPDPSVEAPEFDHQPKSFEGE